MAKTSRDPGWKNLFESNGISPDLGRQRLTHRDIVSMLLCRPDSQRLSKSNPVH